MGKMGKPRKGATKRCLRGGRLFEKGTVQAVKAPALKEMVKGSAAGKGCGSDQPANKKREARDKGERTARGGKGSGKTPILKGQAGGQ